MHKKTFKAFVLLEVAIALGILGIISYISLLSLTHFKDWQSKRITKAHQEKVMQALANYVLIHSRLPCPAATSEGVAPTLCTASVGFIPYKTLSIPEELAKDGAHHWMSYIVNKTLTSSTIVKLDRETSDVVKSDKTFCGTPNTDPLTIKDNKNQDCIMAPDFPAVILISHGKNGGYYLDNCTIQPCTSSDPEKIANTNRSGTYYIKILQAKAGAIFDDIVLFASRYNFMGDWAKLPCKGK